MHRIDTTTAQKDKFGAGKNGFTRGNPQTGVPATDLDDDYFDAIQEELTGVVEGGGLTLNKADRGQVLKALKLLFTANTDSMGALAALIGAANKLPYFTGPKAASLTDLTPVGRNIIGKTTIADVLTYLGLGSLVDALIKTNNLSDLPDKALSRTNLGVPKGVDKQMCNEWCVFNGVTTITMGDSLGISSVTRTGVGQYTVNLTTPYATTNYAVAGRWTSSTIERDHELSVIQATKSVNSFQLYCASDSSNVYPSTDAVELSLSIWGTK
ncbi:hypothetical protein [Kluyvera ascorbata]|uniref:hypothetical protein n=1 Tax=Kluyvera ascorbata TaxID=51288 RepID=UPI0039F67AC7